MEHDIALNSRYPCPRWGTQQMPSGLTSENARFRDVFGFQIGDGTAQIQKQVIARQLIGPAARGR